MMVACRILALSICIGAGLTQAGANQELEKVRLQLKWKHQFQFAGYYAAIDQGFYAEEGLEVELLEPQIGEDPVDVVLAGNAEYGVSNSDIILKYANGEPIVALAVVYQHSPLVLVSLQESGIETLHDLAGKTLIMEAGSADLLAMFRAEGIDTSEINMIPHTFSVDELISGSGEALSAYLTDEPFTLAEMGLHPVIFTPRASGIDFYGDNIFTTKKRIKNHPEEVQRFLRASLKGWEYALKNPDEIIELILSQYSQRKTRAALEYEAMKTKILVRPDLVEIGYMNPGRWEYIFTVFEDVGLIEVPVDLYGFIYRAEPPFPWWVFSYVIIVGAFGIIITLIALRLYRGKVRLEEEAERRRSAESELRESERFFRNVFEGAPLAFLFWNEDLRILRWNKAAENIFGWTSDEAVGRLFMDFLVPDDEFEKVTKGVAEVLQNETSTVHNTNLRKDGERIWCQWHNVAKKDSTGRMIECQSIAIDVTSQQEKEERLVSEKESAVLSAEQKGRFLASVSHEIRNPLAAIISIANMMEETAPSDEGKEFAKMIEASGESLIRILSDLIDHEKIEAGEFEIHPVRLKPAEMIRRMVALYQPLAKAKGVGLHFTTKDEESEVVLDTLRIEQVITNLISNAVKFTEEGTVTLTYEYVSGEELPVRMQVKDTGIGMTEKEASRIFDLYDRGEVGSKGSYSGTGLGLTVSRQLVELMDGRIKVESQVGGGSTFTICLPASIE